MFVSVRVCVCVVMNAAFMCPFERWQSAVSCDLVRCIVELFDKETCFILMLSGNVAVGHDYYFINVSLILNALVITSALSIFTSYCYIGLPSKGFSLQWIYLSAAL